MTVALEPAFEENGAYASLPRPASLQAPSDILSALRELEAEESRIDEELSTMMADRAMLETLLDRIDSVRPVVEQVQLEASELARRIDDTADVAERISGKVRQLDLEQVSIHIVQISSTCGILVRSLRLTSYLTFSHSVHLHRSRALCNR